ncbi:MAG: hypothetical protein E6J91_32235 [Deltaproteobacteria bacterium]|nr:MAG: hypothetical protein E6J91_32235 [Deltaproteobacteria bacterium]
MRVEYGSNVPQPARRDRPQLPALSYEHPVAGCVDASGKQLDTPACSAVVSAHFSGTAAEMITVVLLFLIAFGFFGVLLLLWRGGSTSVIRGESLEHEYELLADETCRAKIIYRNVRNVQRRRLRIPLYLNYSSPSPKNDDKIIIQDLQLDSMSHRAQLEPLFIRESSVYNGTIVEDEGKDSKPLTITIRYTISKALAISAEKLSERWDDAETKQLIDSFKWSSRAVWDKVTIKFKMPKELKGALAFGPWVMVTRAHGDGEVRYEEDGWNKDNWELTLENVMPDESYRIMWQFLQPDSPNDQGTAEQQHKPSSTAT